MDEVYGFREQRQTVPVSEMQYGISRYLLPDEVWEPTLGTVRSWPSAIRDEGVRIFDAFNLYGAPYSIPSYWARYVMNGDQLARSVAAASPSGCAGRACAWRTARPAAHFSAGSDLPRRNRSSWTRRGVTQASTEILTSQATGTALWTLLFYRM